MAGRNLRPSLCLKVQQSLYQQYSSLPYRCIGFKKQLQKYTFPAIWQNKNVTVLRDIGKTAELEPRGLSLWFVDKKKGGHVSFFAFSTNIPNGNNQ